MACEAVRNALCWVSMAACARHARLLFFLLPNSVHCHLPLNRAVESPQAIQTPSDANYRLSRCGSGLSYRCIRAPRPRQNTSQALFRPRRLRMRPLKEASARDCFQPEAVFGQENLKDGFWSKAAVSTYSFSSLTSRYFIPKFGASTLHS